MARLPDVQDLIRQIDRNVDADPLARLRAAVDAGADLAAVGDDVVNHYVLAARDAGLSWADIGACLGVTKQAAQQRFVAPRAPGKLGQVRRGRAYGRMTASARRTLRHAVDAARRLNHPAVDTEHLLLGMLDLGEGVGPEVLASVRPPAEWKAMVEAALGPGLERIRSRLPFTASAHAVLDRAFTVADELGHNRVGTEHQLIALTEVEGGVAAAVLAGGGLDPARAREAVLARPDAAN
jgi:hypothetical protein